MAKTSDSRIIEQETRARSDVRYDGRTKDHDPRSEDRNVPADVYEPPAPGEESAGPAMFDLVKETRRAQEVNRVLLDEASHLLARRRVVERTTGNTDANGLLDLPIYTVPGGFELAVTRYSVEDGVHTPAVPFTNAAAFLVLFVGRGSWQIGNMGAVLDFIPNPPAAGGAIIPAVVTDGVDQAGIVRGGETVSLHVNAPTLINAAIFVRLQGILRAL